MGPFFLFLSGLFYGLCHLVAWRTSANAENLEFYQMKFDSDDKVVLDAIGQWVHKHRHIRIVKNDTHEVIIESVQRWNSFGMFYYFRFNHLEETLVVSIGTKAKLVGDTNEQQRFIASFRGHVFEHLGTVDPEAA